MNARDVAVVDDRTPAPTDLPLATRFPLGAVLAWDGASGDGQRRRAVVIGHGDDRLVLLDGPATVEVPAADLTDAVVLAVSADAYAQRVTAKARELGQTHNWCEVAEQAITELNRTPADADAAAGDLNVVVTYVGHFRLRPQPTARRDVGLDLRDPAQLARAFRDYLTLDVEFNRYAFRTLNGTNRRRALAVRLVDAFPEEAPDAAPA